MLYLRTACSDTLMLRERKASMADRSFSSLTGELALWLCFATLAVLKLPGRGVATVFMKGGRGGAGERRVEIGSADFLGHVRTVHNEVTVEKVVAANQRIGTSGIGDPRNHTHHTAQSEEGGGAKQGSKRETIKKSKLGQQRRLNKGDRKCVEKGGKKTRERERTQR